MNSNNDTCGIQLISMKKKKEDKNVYIQKKTSWEPFSIEWNQSAPN